MSTASAELKTAAKTPTGSGPAGADDLLSQMAGEEIKRLLADSDIDSDSEVHSPAIVDPLLEIMDAPAEAMEPPPITSRELDEVFAKQVATPVSAEVRDSGDAISADGVSDLLGSLSAVDEVEEDGSEGLAARERAALVEPPTEIAEAKPDTLAPKASSVWVARLLDWVTLPLDPFPDRVREIIGKVAIVTMINAVVVLLYLKLFR